MSKVSAAAEEPREEIERIVCLAAGHSALAMLLDSLTAILVIDLSCGWCRQDFVRFGDFNKSLAGRVISSTQHKTECKLRHLEEKR
jgi:hypothetical protein